MQTLTLANTPQAHSSQFSDPCGHDRAILGTVFADIDQCEFHGDQVFYPNDGITWLLLTDRGLNGPRLSGRRRLCAASTTRAVLRYGMPQIHFMGSAGELELPLRPLDRARIMPVEARRWMPRAYLGIPAASAMPLYASVVRHPQPCAEAVQPCDHTLHIACGSRFNQAFNAALSAGLPLHAPEASCYLGSRTDEKDRDGRRRGHPELRVHTFRRLRGDDTYAVIMSADAEILARAGESLEPGQCWCHAFRQSADYTFPTPNHLEALRRAWLHGQSICMPAHANLVFFPAELIAALAAELKPVALVWDFSIAEPFVDSAINAVIFPPMDVQAMSDGRITLPGEVNFHAYELENLPARFLIAS